MRVNDIIGDGSIWMPSKDYNLVKPKVTVVLPTFRRAKNGYFKRAVESVLGQSFRRLELIIVDDCSTDGTFDQIKAFMEQDERVSCIRHSFNIGLPAISEYEAFLKARGTYMAYIFDDNEWNSNALAETYDYMQVNEVKASFGITQVMDPDTKQMAELGHASSVDVSQLLLGNAIGNGAVVLHREVIETVGLYDPHLALTHLCDWDLWLRISDRYAFVGTDIRFTKEYGPILSDSLGNSYKMDPWVAREYMQHRQLSMLQPESFGEYNVIEQAMGCSAFYIDAMTGYIEQYQLKPWFCREQMTLNKASNQQHKYVLVVASTITASCMSFFRFTQKGITIMFCASAQAPRYLCLTDVIIFVRSFLQYTSFKKLYENLAIPLYFYTDDNFIEIAKAPGGSVFEDEIKTWKKKFFQPLTGIICSTETLSGFFRTQKLHENVITLPILFREGTEFIQNRQQKDVVTFAFLGGAARGDMFNCCVLTALQTLSRKQMIRLCCPKGAVKKVADYRSKNFEIVEFARSFNLEYVLQQYKAFEPQFLLHCGPNHRNNIYKTKNALLNALCIGAVLICSDVEPYCCLEVDEPECYAITENSSKQWVEMLQQLIANEHRSTMLFQNAVDYCERVYNEETAWRMLQQEFAQLPLKNAYQKAKLTEALIHTLIVNASFSTNHVSSGGKPFIPEELALSGKLAKGRRYGFTCTTGTLCEIGLLFALLGECEGTVKLDLYDKKQKLDSVNLPIYTLRENAYTVISLNQTLKGYYGKRLSLEISIDYAVEQGEVQLFELRKHRTLLYKVMNKLGHPLEGVDALFVDCKE